MPKFKIATEVPVKQVRCDYFIIEADSLEEAKEIALSGDCWDYFVDSMYTDDDDEVGARTIYDYEELTNE